MTVPAENTTPAPHHAIRHCRDLTRFHSKTFYFGSRFFPAEQRRAVWAVYAVCRSGDDAVDEGEPGSADQRLERWWGGVQAAFEGQVQNHPIFDALSWAVHRYPIPFEAFQELHQGLRMDLTGHPYQDMNDLELYCRRVAGVVGFMIAPIAGFEGGQSTLERALKLGQAMQLTNILRDVGEDAGRGRVYLPATLLRQYGVTDDEIRSGVITTEYGALMRHLVGVARAWYAEGRSGIPCLHGRSRLAVAAATSAYEGILDSLERNQFDNFSRRAQVSAARKLLMLPRVLWHLRPGRA